MRIDFAVIGGGIVGVSVAREILSRHPAARLVLLEAEPDLGRHQTGHNSGVIHAGVYYAPGSLKARLCREGQAATKEFCREHGITVKVPGKLIVATSDEETTRLRRLAERAEANAIDVDWVGPAELRRREPNVTGTAALFVPGTGIVDYGQVTRAMAALVRAAGGVIETNTAVTRIEETPTGVIVGDGRRTWTADRVVVCAGLQSDRLAALAGLAVDFRIVPFRGDYHRLPDSRAGLVRHLIYPVPDPALPFLGVHLTPDLDGRITVGPNAVLAFSRGAYRRLALDGRDLWSLASFPGMWRVARRNARTGLAELRDAHWRTGYLRRCQRYAPALTRADLGERRAGIRAQAVRRDGTLVDDFLFLQTNRMLHVCNAPSPAATSAIPIARMITDRLAA